MATFDTIISGGRVLDGTGSDERRADIGIRDGQIVAVEASLADAEGEVIDATDRIVTPGFVDIHTHYDGQVTWDEVLEPSTHHGVTTVVMGNCGVGFAPVRPTDHHALIELMEGVEDIPGAALSEGITWGWESFPEYLNVLDKRRWAVDVGTQLAHGPLRTYVMGPTASDAVSAFPDQISDMGRLAREAIDAGAFGFTTSRTLGHKALDGRPVPGTYAAIDELTTIARNVAAGGHRIMEFAASGLALSDPAQTVSKEFEWIGRLAGDHDLTTTFLLLQNQGDPERWRSEMHQAAEWRSAGAPVYPLVAGRPFGVLWGWDVRHPFSARPSYKAIAHLPLAERLVELRKPAVRAAILSEQDEPVDKAESGQLYYISKVLGDCQLISGVPDYEQPRSMTVGAIAEVTGESLEAVTYDGLVADNAMILYALYNYTDWDHGVLYEQMQDPETVLAGSDGGAHVAYICDASIPTFMMTHWARDRSRGPRVPLPEVVRRLTSQTSDLYGLNDRGRLVPGLRADINIIDHDRLTLTTPAVSHDLPTGGARLLQPATGYDITMVAGQVTRRGGVDTGARPGRLLRAS
jgi:N-acyl-D-amino-acid deacylase